MTLHRADLKYTGPALAPDPESAAHASRNLAAAMVLMLCGAGTLSLSQLRLLPAQSEIMLLPARQSGMLTVLLAAALLAASATGAVWVRARTASRTYAGLRVLPRARGMVHVAFAVFAAGSVTAIGLSAWALLSGFAPPPVSPAGSIALASIAVFLAFPFLIAERLVAALPAATQAGAAALRRCASLPIACLLACAAACFVTAAGVNAVRPAVVALAVFLALAGIELAVRVIAHAVLFRAPVAVPGQRTSPELDLLLLRPLDGRVVRPRAWSATLREKFGLDFARSWALQYAARAALPLGSVLVALCVLLTGVVRIDTTERGIYQRLGRPVGVLRPGLHLLLPWPLGQVRRVEYGVVHAVPISFGDADTSPDAALVTALASTAPATAEGPPPASANRLWESSQPSDVTYLIASDETAHAGAGLANNAGESSQPEAQPALETPQRHGGFELISVSMRVLYRIGLDNASAQRAAYAVCDPETLVRMAASQLLARHLAVRTLQQVLVEDRGGMARSLGAGLQAMLDRLNTGIKVLSIAVEAAHPPAGAAAAYRQVQAAEIGAHTAISVERGRAETTAGLAARDAADAQDNAVAGRAERVARAQAQRTAMRADAAAYLAAPGAFLLERRLAALQAALGSGAADILDPRLDAATPPTLDLRQADHAAPPVPHQDTAP